MKLFDTHCHIAADDFDADRGGVISRMREAGVSLAVVVGDISSDGEKAISLAKENDCLYAAIGLHPHDARLWTDELREDLKKALKSDKVVALGETGLDYHYDFSPRDAQRIAFEAQLDTAFDMNLPAILHIREAHGETTEILRSFYRAGRLPKCVMHCFSGSWESARAYLDMGLYISFTGVITFKNARKLVEVAQKMPLDRLMVETDCPYMAPVPMRGKRNEPAYVAYTARAIAAMRGVGEDELALAAYNNALRFFNVKEAI
ncbi:MAG: TatD family hydrolase [Clostridia bacterium]|nr:TatD family hydrolase [Clostridia bacterium]